MGGGPLGTLDSRGRSPVLGPEPRGLARLRGVVGGASGRQPARPGRNPVLQPTWCGTVGKKGATQVLRWGHGIPSQTGWNKGEH